MGFEMIGLETARKVIAATRAAGHAKGMAPLTVVVLDRSGHFVAKEREDGSAYGRPEIASGKAAGALAMGVSSRRLGEMAWIARSLSLPSAMPGTESSFPPQAAS